MQNKILTIVLALQLTAVIVWGGKADDKIKPPQMTFRMLFSNGTANSSRPDWAAIGTNGEVIPLGVTPWYFSSPVTQSKGNCVRLYRRQELVEALKEKKSEKDKATDLHLPNPVVEIPISEGLEDFLIIMRSDEKQSPDKWEYQLFNAAVGSYPGGTRMFMNMTENRLRGYCGSLQFEVAPNANYLLNPKITNPQEMRQHVELFATQPRGEINITDEIWGFDPDIRGIVLVFQVGSDVRVVTVPDILPPKQEDSDKAVKVNADK